MDGGHDLFGGTDLVIWSFATLTLEKLGPTLSLAETMPSGAVLLFLPCIRLLLSSD